jgi:hypothetical protein
VAENLQKREDLENLGIAGRVGLDSLGSGWAVMNAIMNLLLP